MMKKIILVLFFLLLGNSVFSWSYPLRQISKPTAKCKFNYWKNLGSDCKINLPKLTPSLYLKYKNDTNFYRRIYTVLWAGSYKYGWDQGNGTHLGTDIATSNGTPVYSIGEGRVVFVGYKRGWGKTVVIQHKVNGKYIYSNYAHLSKINVVFNQKVNSSTKIGEVGHSGNSYGNHLHFQIDTNQSIGAHPFWFRYCSKGKTIYDIVNNTYCLAEMEKSTIDPLKFLQTNAAIVNQVIQKKEYKPSVKISRKNLVSYEDIQKRILNEFLRTHKFSFKFSNAGVYYLGKYGIFTISLKDRRGREYKDLLPEDIEIVYDKNFFSSFSPRGLKVIDGIRKISFLPKKTGTTYITIKIGKKILYTKAIRIVKKGQYINVEHAKIITLAKYPYVGTPNWAINIFQDKKYINIVKVPFNGYYYISSTTNDLIFCKPLPNLKYINYFKCNSYNSSNFMRFSYKDTIFGIFVFKYYSNTGKTTQIIVKNSKGKIIAKSKFLKFKKIRFTYTNSPYLPYISSVCKKGLCLNVVDKGYIWNNKDLNKAQAKYIISNLLNYFGKKKTFKVYKQDKYKKITRIYFIKILFTALQLKLKDYKNYKSNYIDIRNLPILEQNYIKYLSKLGFKWKDRFSNYHFQPNKNITIEEALYLVNFLLTKYR